MSGTRSARSLMALAAAAAVGASTMTAAGGTEPEDPPPEPAEEGSAALADALLKDLGMTLEEFHAAGALAERSSPELEAAGETAVGLISADAGDFQVLGGDTAPASADFADLAELRDGYLAGVGTEGLTSLVYTADGYQVAVIDPDEAYDRGRLNPAAPLLSPAEWAERHTGVSVRVSDGPSNPAASLLGGASISFGTVGCSHGFNGYYQGDEVGISAGHCVLLGGRNVYASQRVGTVGWWQFGAPGSALETWGTDLTTFQLTSNYDYPPRIKSSSSSVTLTGQAPAAVGMPVCKYGRRTLWSCSKVSKIGWQWIGDGSGDINKPKRWVWSLFADTRVIPGDSGGPWISGRKAVGITSSYDWHADGSPYSTAALLTSLDKYRAGAAVKIWLGQARLPSANFSDKYTASARWVPGERVYGVLNRHSGDTVAPGTKVVVTVDGTPIATRSVRSDGAFSFAFEGSATQGQTVKIQARNGSSRGRTVTITNRPSGRFPDIERHAGSNRYGTAARIALAEFGSGVDTVYVASGRNFPDALAGGALAGSEGAPVLLTAPASLPGQTRAALTNLAPERIVVLGGTKAVSSGVRQNLAAYAPTERIAGTNRYETAAEVAAGYPAGLDTVFVATGRNYPDALTAAARAGHLDVPVLLTMPDRVPTAMADRLEQLSPQEIVILGGSTAVHTSVEDALAAYAPTVSRIGGANRYVVAAAVADRYPAQAEQAWLGTGRDFPDALSAAPVAAANSAPVLLTHPSSLSSPARRALLRLEPEVVHLAGGTAALSRRVQYAVRWLTYPS